MDWDHFHRPSQSNFTTVGGMYCSGTRTVDYTGMRILCDPIGGHKDLLDFWGVDVPEDCIIEAFKRITPEEMKREFLRPSSSATGASRAD